MPTDTTYATGKRKLAICRAWLQTGSGRITVNGRSIESYFPRATHRAMATYPLEVTNLLDKFNVNATISGGGTVPLRSQLSRARSTASPRATTNPIAASRSTMAGRLPNA